jgi:hypothetical protein
MLIQKLYTILQVELVILHMPLLQLLVLEIPKYSSHTMPIMVQWLKATKLGIAPTNTSEQWETN